MTHALGRNVNHDPRSLRYRVRSAGAKPATVLWRRALPVLDQGQLGSCTGNAGTGVLGSEVIAATLSPGAFAKLGEAYAVQLYSDATKVDSAPGTYPPTDTGSDGLSIAKVLTARGLIAGYQHVTTMAAAFNAIAAGPFIVGTNWYGGMFEPDSSGLVKVSGSVEGGHEYQALGYDADADRWEFVNSWGDGWGRGGHFFYSTATFTRLLAEQGDATTFVPITEAPPTPDPAPPADDHGLAAARAVLDPWAAKRHTGANGRASAAWRAYSVAQA